MKSKRWASLISELWYCYKDKDSLQLLLWSIKQKEIDSFDYYFTEAISSVDKFSSKILIGKCIVGNEDQIVSPVYWIWRQAEPQPWWFWVIIGWLPGGEVSSTPPCIYLWTMYCVSGGKTWNSLLRAHIWIIFLFTGSTTFLSAFFFSFFFLFLIYQRKSGNRLMILAHKCRLTIPKSFNLLGCSKYLKILKTIKKRNQKTRESSMRAAMMLKERGSLSFSNV